MEMKTGNSHCAGGNRARRWFSIWSAFSLPMARAKSSTTTTRRLAVMNLALRGIEADFGPERANTSR